MPPWGRCLLLPLLWSCKYLWAFWYPQSYIQVKGRPRRTFLTLLLFRRVLLYQTRKTVATFLMTTFLNRNQAALPGARQAHQAQTRGKFLLAKTPTKTSINEGNLTLCCLWCCNYAEMIFIPFQTLWTTTTGPRTRPAFASHLPSASAWWTPAPWRPRPKAGQQSRRFRPVPSIPGNWAGRSGSGPRRPSA